MRIPRRWLARLTIASVIPLAAGALTMPSSQRREARAAL